MWKLWISRSVYVYIIFLKNNHFVMYTINESKNLKNRANKSMKQSNHAIISVRVTFVIPVKCYFNFVYSHSNITSHSWNCIFIGSKLTILLYLLALIYIKLNIVFIAGIVKQHHCGFVCPSLASKIWLRKSCNWVG